MAIHNIKIKDFTVFKDIVIDFNNGVNVFIGENGTGKTHLLKLIYAVWLKREETFFNLEKIFGKSKYNINLAYYKKEIDNSLIMEQLNKAKSHFELSLVNGILEPIDPLPSENIVTIESTDPYIPLFIPVKEMLSMSNIMRIDEKYSKELYIDKTLLDIIKKSQNIKPDKIPELAVTIVSKLEKIIDGKVFIKDDNSFWVRKNYNLEIPFSMEAEGFKKLGLLWQLLMNESITKDTVLLWDEPEANINPKFIPDIVEIMFELAKQGVQIFVSTHDYVLAKYFEVKAKDSGEVSFHSLYKDENAVKCESNTAFRNLNNNPILTAFNVLMDEVIDRNMGD